MIKSLIIYCAGGYQRYLHGMISVKGEGYKEVSIEHKVRTIREILWERTDKTIREILERDVSIYRKMVNIYESFGVMDIVLVVGWKKDMVEKLFTFKPYVKFVRIEAFFMEKNGKVEFITNEHGKKVGNLYSLLQTQQYWKDETIALASDTICSREAYKEMFDYELKEKDIVFFGIERILNNPKLGPAYDVFGVKFNEEGQKILLSLGETISLRKSVFKTMRCNLELLQLSLAERDDCELYIVKNFIREINSVGEHRMAVSELYKIPEEKEHFYPEVKGKT